MNAIIQEKPALLKLNLGCGRDIKSGWTNVDSRKFDGVDQVVNLADWRNWTGPCPDCQGHPDKGIPHTSKCKNREVGFALWPWADESVEEVHMSHVLEHFTAIERVHIANEMHRVLIPGGKVTIITPHWANNRSYGDPTHQWPPVSEMWYLYLHREWRKSQAPHTDIEWNPEGFSCDFDWITSHTFDTSANGKFVGRNNDYIGFALANYRDAVMDLQATITKRGS